MSGEIYCLHNEGTYDYLPNMFNATNLTVIDCREYSDSLTLFGGGLSGVITRYVVFVIILMFGVVTAFGNLAIIACVVKSRRLNCTNYSVYVVSLAISDLLVGALCIPAMALYTFYGYWPLGRATCTAFLVCDMVCCTTSNMHLDMIAYDRFRAVADPLTYRSKFTKARARKLAATLWSFNILYYLLSIVVVRVRDGLQGDAVSDQCWYPPNAINITGTIVLTTWGPSIVLVVLYFVLVARLRNRNTSQKTTKSQITSGPSHGVVKSDESLASTGESAKIDGQNRRCLLTLLAQVVLFLICWFPWSVVFPVSSLCEGCVPPAIFEIAYWIAFANSMCNPILYLIFNKDYRYVFRNMMSCAKNLSVVT